MPDEPNGNDFREYRRLIIAGLERANERLDKVDERLTRIEKDITMLTVKISLYGAGAGTIAAAIVTALMRSL